MTLDLPTLVQALSEPVSSDAPCGVSLRHQPEYDAMREARRQDDAALPTGVWQSTLKTADWALVERLAIQALTQQSKDLMIAGWLGEAWLHRSGLEGLAAALTLLGNLCEAYWPGLYPLATDGDESWRASPLEWIVRTYSDALHTQMPLPGLSSHTEYGRTALDQYQVWQRQRTPATDTKPAKTAAEAANAAIKKIHETIGQSSADLIQSNARYLQQCQRQLARIEGICNAQMQGDAPSFGAIRRALDQLDIVLQEFQNMVPVSEPQNDSAVTTPEAVSAQPPAPFPVSTPQVANSREDAYRQLKVIADYLARTEPHSPVPYLIYRAVEWGNKPLPALLSELISSDAEARRLWSLLGVLP